MAVAAATEITSSTVPSPIDEAYESGESRQTAPLLVAVAPIAVQPIGIEFETPPTRDDSGIIDEQEDTIDESDTLADSSRLQTVAVSTRPVVVSTWLPTATIATPSSSELVDSGVFDGTTTSNFTVASVDEIEASKPRRMVSLSDDNIKKPILSALDSDRLDSGVATTDEFAVNSIAAR